MTEEQIATLDGVATALGIEGGKAALIRTAIDYWMEHDRAARLAAQRLNRRTEK
jgi:hypothetical protein